MNLLFKKKNNLYKKPIYYTPALALGWMLYTLHHRVRSVLHKTPPFNISLLSRDMALFCCTSKRTKTDVETLA